MKYFIFLSILFLKYGLCDAAQPTSIFTNKPVGLGNCGNSCYFNSILQPMLKCNIITNFLLNPASEEFYQDNSLPYFYRNFVNYYNTQSINKVEEILTSDQPLQELHESVIDTYEFGNTQQDAQEAFSGILDKLCSREFSLDHFTIRNAILAKCPQYTNYTNNIKITQGKAKDALVDNMLSCAFKQAGLEKSLYDYFNINVKSVVTCTTCNKQHPKDEPALILAVPISTTTKSVQESLNNFSQEELLTGDNQFYCQNCKAMRDATKVLTISNTPEYLVIQLKIFDSVNEEKIMSNPNLNINNLKLPSSKDSHYELFGSSWHMGSLGGGHYISIVKSGDSWYECDDDRVTQISNTNKFENQTYKGAFTPYLLFYKCVNTTDHDMVINLMNLATILSILNN